METIGRYEIISELARGGMATVYLARDPHFNRQVAIKVLPRTFTHDPEFLARFKREAEVIASLEHQFVVPVYDFGEDDNQPYLVMRLMSGGSLADRIKRGPIPVAEAIEILRPIATALDHAHAHGIIHRDVKPANILFDQNGGAYLSDFGIIKLTEATASFTGSAVIGTPAYMSPEQIQGGVKIDGRSDLYALGITLYEMLSGEVPYKGETTTQQLMKHILEPVPRITQVKSNVPPGVEAMLVRALAKDRDSRYPTGAALVQGLADAQSLPGATLIHATAEPPSDAQYAQTLPARAPAPPQNRAPSSPAYPPTAPRPRKRIPTFVLVGLIALAVLVVGGGGALLALQPWKAEPAPTDTPVATAANTVEPTDTPVSTSTPTNTPGVADADTVVATNTVVATATVAATRTVAATSTATATPPPSPTTQPTNTPTARPTNTPTSVPPTNTPVPPTHTPVPPTSTPTLVPQVDTVHITNITIHNDRYSVDFVTSGFAPTLPGQHVHFFFNTVTPQNAGMPGSGPWQLYPASPGQPGTSPFTMYAVSDRPPGATQLCVLVANADHSVNQGTGNCFDLP